MYRQVTNHIRDLLRSRSTSIQPSVASSVHKRPKVIQFSTDHDALIRNAVSANRPLSTGEWTELRTRLLNSDSLINEVNIDATILGRCLPGGQLDVGKSYMQFLNASGIVPNLATVGRMLRLYHASQSILSDEDQNEIIKICNDLESKLSTYDANTSENMLHALTKTSEWRKSISLLDSIKLTANPSTSAYSALITRAFAEKDESLGWKILNECVSAEKIPRCEVYIAYIRMCLELHTEASPARFDAINKIIQFVGQNGLMMTQVVVDELKRVHLETGSKCVEVTITEKGNCPNCSTKLRSVFLTNKEFKELSSTFLEKVLVRKDAFIKTTPAEVAKFEQFLRSHPPFHCVIDGLNVAFSTGIKTHGANAKLLSAVVRYFVDQKKRVLVLGRKHMQKWPKTHMSFVYNNAKIFLAEDLSQDDPFLLYAALKSGPSTDFVSRDLMRGHAHLLGPEMKAIFRRWQQEHQFVLEVGSHPGRINIREPLKYQTTAHTVNGNWHIPFMHEYNQSPPDSHTMPPRWLCIVPSK